MANVRYRETNPEGARAASRRYAVSHPEVNRASVRRYALRHPEQVRERVRTAKHLRRETPFAWTRLAPWPSGCGICGRPFEGSFPSPLAETLGHEPPIAWMRAHPEYDGPLLIRPEHWACNIRKGARPDWEAAA